MIKSGQTSGNRQRKRHAHRLIAAAWAMPATSMPAAAVALLAAPAAQAQDAARSFDIPAQPLADALTSFGQQSGLQVSTQAPLVEGRNSTAVKGAMPALQALSRLLAGTGLAFRVAGTTVSLEPAPQGAGAISLGPVRVEGEGAGTEDTAPDAVPGIKGYVATRGAGATKTDTPLIRIPASISVVTHAQIVDQDAQSTSQALRYTPGIVAEQRGINEDSLEYLYTRGFQARTFIDGLTIPFSGFNIATRDTYLIDRVESVRGPVSVVYGQTPPGGLVNIVSKQPTTQPLHEVFFETGSYGRARGGFDFGGALNGSGTLSYRLTAVAMTTGTQTNYVRQKRIAVAPALTWKPDERNTLTIIGNYQKDPEAGAFNYVPAVGTVLPGKVTIPRSLNTGDPGYDVYRKEEESIAYRFEHRFSDALKFRQNFRYMHNSQTIHHVGDGSSYDSTGTALTRIAYNNYGTVDAISMDNQLTADFATGAVHHTFVAGVDLLNTQFDHHLYYSRLDGQNPANLVIADPVYFQNVPAPNFLLGSSTRERTQQAGIYAQDQATLGRLTLVGGLRQDWAGTHSVSYKTGSITDQSSHALTGRLGAVYQITDSLAPYVSWSTSFQPQAGNTDTGAPLKPTKGKQVEAGIKFQPAGGKSFVTLAVYDLRQTNVTVSNSLYTGSITQTGEVRSRGVEAEAHAYLTDRVQMIASYTHDEVRNTSATANILGKAPAGIPQDMAALWLSYDMPATLIPGLKASAGVRYVGASFGNPTNTFKVPGYTLADLGMQYDVGRALPKLTGVKLSVNVSNLFDHTYVTCTDLTYCTFGQGRQVLAGIKYAW